MSTIDRDRVVRVCSEREIVFIFILVGSLAEELYPVKLL